MNKTRRRRSSKERIDTIEHTMEVIAAAVLATGCVS
jgi:hypothetical protein